MRYLILATMLLIFAGLAALATISGLGYGALMLFGVVSTVTYALYLISEIRHDRLDNNKL